MPDDLTIRLRMQGADVAARDAKKVASGVDDIGTASRSAAASAKLMGSAVADASEKAKRSLSRLGQVSRYGSAGLLGGLVFGAAGAARWGLSFDAQLQDAEERFRTFTNSVQQRQQLLKGVQGIDRNSAFNFGDLANEAAQLGNYGVAANKIIPTLKGIANAAAVAGNGTAGLQQIGLAVGQIASKGRLQQQELLQLTNAGAPNALQIVRKEFNLTAKQAANLGNMQLSATRSINALTAAWTSGKMANAAKRQIATLGGQWSLLTGEMQHVAGDALLPLANALQKNVLPAANNAAAAIDKIIGTKGLSNAQKWRQIRTVIDQQLGPVWKDFTKELDQANIPGKLDDAVAAAAPKVLSTMFSVGAHGAEAFAKGWLNASLGGQLAGGELLLHVLGLDKTIAKGVFSKVRAALNGGTSASGGSAGLFARGGAPDKPLFVYAVNGMGKGPSGGPWSNDASRTAYTAPKTKAEQEAARDAEKAAQRASRLKGAARFVGGAAALAVDPEVLAAAIGYDAYLKTLKSLGIAQGYKKVTPVDPNWHPFTAKQQAANALYIEGASGGTGYINGKPVTINITTQVDKTPLARTTAKVNANEQGRVTAAQKARK